MLAGQQVGSLDAHLVEIEVGRGAVAVGARDVAVEAIASRSRAQACRVASAPSTGGGAPRISRQITNYP